MVCAKSARRSGVEVGRSRLSRAGVLFFAATLLAALFPAAATGQQPQRWRAQRVMTKSQKAIEKLHPRLRSEYRSGATKDVRVFAVVMGDVRAARALLDDAHVARAPRGAALVVGRLGAQSLPKLAGIRSVVSVGPVDFPQTGRPLLSDPDLLDRPDAEELRARLDKLRDGELTYRQARPGLPARRHRPRKRASARRPDGGPRDLSARAARSER